MVRLHYPAAALCVAVTMLVGCGGSQPLIGAHGVTPQSHAIVGHADRGRSWMLPAAKSEDLLYLSNSTSVSVYSYPQAQPVGSLSDVGAGMCSDKNGNIWIANFNSNTVTEYQHGGTTPIAILNTSGLAPSGCAVDPTSGDLAVAGYPPPSSTSRAEVLVYPGSTGSPHTYSVPLSSSNSCGYDNSGNLFVDGYRYQQITKSGLVELQRSAEKFRQVSFGASGPFFGNAPVQLQWDGEHLAIGLGAQVLQLSIHHFRGVVKRVINFDSVHQVGGFWIQGRKIVLLNLFGEGSYPPAQIDKYPSGGPPTITIGDSSDGQFSGATISRAPQ